MWPAAVCTMVCVHTVVCAERVSNTDCSRTAQREGKLCAGPA